MTNHLEQVQLTDRIGKLHLGPLGLVCAEEPTRDLIWEVVRAHRERRKFECGICRQQAHIDPEHAVMLHGLLRFCCDGCFGRVERAIMDPPMPDRDGV